MKDIINTINTASAYQTILAELHLNDSDVEFSNITMHDGRQQRDECQGIDHTNNLLFRMDPVMAIPLRTAARSPAGSSRRTGSY